MQYAAMTTISYMDRLLTLHGSGGTYEFGVA